MYRGPQERIFIEDKIVVDPYGRVMEERVVVDDIYYGNGVVEEKIMV